MSVITNFIHSILPPQTHTKALEINLTPGAKANLITFVFLKFLFYIACPFTQILDAMQGLQEQTLLKRVRVLGTKQLRNTLTFADNHKKEMAYLAGAILTTVVAYKLFYRSSKPPVRFTSTPQYPRQRSTSSPQPRRAKVIQTPVSSQRESRIPTTREKSHINPPPRTTTTLRDLNFEQRFSSRPTQTEQRATDAAEKKNPENLELRLSYVPKKILQDDVPADTSRVKSTIEDFDSNQEPISPTPSKEQTPPPVSTPSPEPSFDSKKTRISPKKDDEGYSWTTKVLAVVASVWGLGLLASPGEREAAARRHPRRAPGAAQAGAAGQEQPPQIIDQAHLFQGDQQFGGFGREMAGILGINPDDFIQHIRAENELAAQQIQAWRDFFAPVQDPQNQQEMFGHLHQLMPQEAAPAQAQNQPGQPRRIRRADILSGEMVLNDNREPRTCILSVEQIPREDYIQLGGLDFNIWSLINGLVSRDRLIDPYSNIPLTNEQLTPLCQRMHITVAQFRGVWTLAQQRFQQRNAEQGLQELFLEEDRRYAAHVERVNDKKQDRFNLLCELIRRQAPGVAGRNIAAILTANKNDNVAVIEEEPAQPANDN